MVARAETGPELATPVRSGPWLRVFLPNYHYNANGQIFKGVPLRDAVDE